MVSPFALFAPELRRLGFRKTWSHQFNGERVTQWNRTTPDAITLGYRQISVQIWADGGHRVSHGINNRETTLPTDFTTIEELRAAIDHEMSRQDNLNVVAAKQAAGLG